MLGSPDQLPAITRTALCGADQVGLLALPLIAAFVVGIVATLRLPRRGWPVGYLVICAFFLAVKMFPPPRLHAPHCHHPPRDHLLTLAEAKSGLARDLSPSRRPWRRDFSLGRLSAVACPATRDKVAGELSGIRAEVPAADLRRGPSGRTTSSAPWRTPSGRTGSPTPTSSSGRGDGENLGGADLRQGAQLPAGGPKRALPTPTGRTRSPRFRVTSARPAKGSTSARTSTSWRWTALRTAESRTCASMRGERGNRPATRSTYKHFHTSTKSTC